jgi:hypothetical protein
VFRIHEILARIRILGSVPEKTDPDQYKNLRIVNKNHFSGIGMEGNSKMYLALSKILFCHKNGQNASSAVFAHRRDLNIFIIDHSES